VVLPEKRQRPQDFHLRGGAAEGLLPARLEQRRRVTLVAVGDLMPHPFLSSSPHLYDEVAGLFSEADWCSANLESPVCEAAASVRRRSSLAPPALGFSRDQLEAAVQLPTAAPRHVALANNHILDHGPVGVEATLATLDELGVGSLGITAPDRALQTPVMQAVGGVTLGVIAFTFGLNGNRPPREAGHHVDVANLNDHLEPVNLARLRRQVEACRSAGAELVVAHLHWGLEFELFPTRKQQRMARHICDLGVDLIFSHHPHVIQPIELYRPRREPERVVPICYSLGNLISPFTARIYRLALVVRVVVAQGMLAGRRRTFVERVTPSPVMLVDDGQSAVTLRPLGAVADEGARQEAEGYVRQVLGAGLVNRRSGTHTRPGS
jgi:poly-gamma-glutamate synthesis protein (capsule biosynthesis protein)